MNVGGNPNPLTPDTLRAELGELELRLTRFIADQLLRKADVADLTDVRIMMDRLLRGELTEALLGIVDDRIEAALAGRDDRMLSHRGALVALLLFVIALATLTLNITVALKGGTL